MTSLQFANTLLHYREDFVTQQSRTSNPPLNPSLMQTKSEGPYLVDIPSPTYLHCGPLSYNAF